jgi:hypothetical protein
MPRPQVAPLSKPPSLEGLDDEERIDAMVSWFFENFEDPAHEMPYDGREGGYQYIWGGPYEASDYIGDAFPDASEEEHQEAIDHIDADGPDWAPAGHRILPPDDDDYDVDTEPIEERLEQLASQLDKLQGQVSKILSLQKQEATPGIGHNNPPPDEDTPDLQMVLDSINQVRAELEKQNALEKPDPKVLQVAETRFGRFRNWITGLAKETPTLMAKRAVSATGGALLTYVYANFTEIHAVASSVIDTVHIWASHLASGI